MRNAGQVDRDDVDVAVGLRDGTLKHLVPDFVGVQALAAFELHHPMGSHDQAVIIEDGKIQTVGHAASIRGCTAAVVYESKRRASHHTFGLQLERDVVCFQPNVVVSLFVGHGESP